MPRRPQAEQGRTERRAYPAWWWGAVAGLLIGFIAGLILKPGNDALLTLTLDLVPGSARILETGTPGVEFVEFLGSAGSPFAYAQFTSPLPPAELAAQLDELARQHGWNLLPAEERPNAIRRPLRSLLFEARMSTLLSSGRTEDDNDASINVRRHDWTGPTIVATSSLLTAAIGGFIRQRRHRHGTPTPVPSTLWLNAFIIAALWAAALSFVR